MSTTTAHDNSEQGKGVLVVHGDGAAAWLSPLPPAVASVRVPVGRGAVVEVDAANPTLVIGWGLQSDGDPAALAQAFGHPQLGDELQILANTGEEVFVKSAPTLTDAWVRRATVAAVAQCTMRPISHGVLLLDQATAEHAAGRTEIATDIFEMAAPSLLELGEDCLSGYITGGAATDLAHIARVAAQSLAGSGWQPDVAELADSLDQEVSSLSDDLLAGVLAMFEQDAAVVRGFAAIDLGPTETALRFVVDPAAVPPRLLTWLGADHAEVLVTPLSDPQRAVVTCALSPATDPRATEVSELFAYAADRALGTVVAIAPMHVDGRTVTGTVQCDQDPTQLRFGVFHADTDPATLRLDAVGQLLVDVDRRMLDAYRYHRLSLAAIHKQDLTTDVSDAEAKRDTYRGLASFEAMSAAGAIDSFFLEESEVSEQIVGMLEKRKAAIEAYQLALDEPGGVPPAGTTPLLTELLPVDLDTADDEDIDDGD